MNKLKNDKKVRISERQLNQLKDISNKEGYSISFIIRTILQDYITIYIKNNQKKDE